MTLRKKEKLKIAIDPIDPQISEKFKQMIIELAVYLGNFKSKIPSCTPLPSEVFTVDSAVRYKDYILGYNSNHSLNHYFIFIANDRNTLSTNPYIKIIVENIFPAFSFFEAPYFDYYVPYEREFRDSRELDKDKWMIPYNSNAEDFKITKENLDVRDDLELLPVTWRTDIIYPREYEKKIFSNVIKSILSQSTGDWWKEAKYYNVFWNLFAVALDDDIYNGSIPAVVDLAHYLDFDEPMLRDWCRAVEYVMSGKKLSPDCDLECETVEGARFFLHKEE